MTATAPRLLAQLFASSLPLAWRAAAIAAVAIAAGWVGNHFRQQPLEIKAYRPPTECSEASESATSSVMSAKAVSALCGRDDVLFADARDEAQFELGHVTGAMHLACTSSRGDVGQLLNQVKDKHTLVVYGNSTDEARRVADGLLRQTKRRDLAVIVLEGGFAAWRDTGLACSSGACENCNESISSATP